MEYKNLFKSRINLAKQINELKNQIEIYKKEKSFDIENIEKLQKEKALLFEQNNKEIDDLKNQLNIQMEKNMHYENKYIKTVIECKYCYSMMQKGYNFCPTCGKQSIYDEEIDDLDYKEKNTLFEIEDDIGGCVIVKYNGFSNKKIVIPSSISGKTVKGIMNNVFKNCKDIEVVEFMGGCECIGNEAFYGCDNLNNIRFPKTLKEIGHGAFQNCKSLEEVIMPSSVSCIGNSVFCGCESLKKVILSESLKQISKRAFADTALYEIIIPDGIEYIDDECFKDNVLKQVSFPQNLRYIGYASFSGNKLSKVIAYDNIKEIRPYAFNCNENLIVYCEGGSITHIYCRNNNIDCKELKEKCDKKNQLDMLSGAYKVGISETIRNPKTGVINFREDEEWRQYLGFSKAKSWCLLYGSVECTINKYVNGKEALDFKKNMETDKKNVSLYQYL